VVATGWVVHSVLERYGEDSDDLAALIEDAIAVHDEDAPGVETPAGAAYRAMVRARVEAATASPVWQEIARAPSARRELAFTRVLADGTAISGAMDLAARHGNSAQVLDVKTSTVDVQRLAERYAVQGAVYTDAVRAIAGAHDVTFTLLTLPAAASTPVSAAVDVAALVAQLRAWRGA
jgi:ATP-dependent exoDNAse (exonuclease V) beta subunit